MGNFEVFCLTVLTGFVVKEVVEINNKALEQGYNSELDVSNYGALKLNKKQNDSGLPEEEEE